MDNQMKRGLLDVCVLSAIRDEDGYGYQIVKDMKPYVSISESTLYPRLRGVGASRNFRRRGRRSWRSTTM